MKRIAIIILVMVCVVSCKKEETVDFDDKDSQGFVKVTGSVWTSPMTDLDDKVDAMVVFEDKLFLSYLFYNGGAFGYSGIYNERELTTLLGTMGNSFGFDRFRVYDNNLYMIGGAGVYPVWRYNTEKSEPYDKYWLSEHSANTTYNDFAILDGVKYGATTSSPYVFKIGSGSLGEGLNGSVYCLTVYKGNLYAAGSFTKSGSLDVNGVAKWNGTKWEALGTGVDGSVYDMVVYEDKLVITGKFEKAGTTTVNYIAQWDGNAWSALGTGLDAGFAGGRVVYAHGSQLFVGGQFEKAGSIISPNIAKWEDGKWGELPGGVSDVVGSIAVYRNKLYIANEFDGSSNFVLRLD